MIYLLGILSVRQGPARLCDCSFESQNCGGAFLRFLPADQTQKLRNIGEVRSPFARKVSDEIVPIWQTKLSLTDYDCVFVRRFGVNPYGKAKDRAKKCLCHKLGEISACICAAQHFDERSQRASVNG